MNHIIVLFSLFIYFYQFSQKTRYVQKDKPINRGSYNLKSLYKYKINKKTTKNTELEQ